MYKRQIEDHPSLEVTLVTNREASVIMDRVAAIAPKVRGEGVSPVSYTHLSMPLIGGIFWFVMARCVPHFKRMQQKLDRIGLLTRESLSVSYTHLRARRGARNRALPARRHARAGSGNGGRVPCARSAAGSLRGRG